MYINIYIYACKYGCMKMYRDKKNARSSGGDFIH